jgi:peptide-methionine (S)-S-oxide reductase
MRKISLLSLTAILIFSVVSTNALSQTKAQKMNTMKATFGGGCFWCTEAIFSQLKGVNKVTSGYSGGHVSNPTYKEVCNGNTGHAECIQIEFDPTEIAYAELLEVFWMTHDPTTLNRQGADVGTQYRSVIFYHDEEQKQAAISIKEKLNKEKIWNDPIVTEIIQFEKFCKAEDYHQNYYPNNKNQGYCRIVITPKIEKFKKVFSDKIIKP